MYHFGMHNHLVYMLKQLYCYMDHNPKTMTTDIVDMSIKQIPKILDIFGFSNYRITYFGGEPLENFELIKYTHKLDKPLCINEVMISNLLLLTEDKLNYFKESNIGISWSFDGNSFQPQFPSLPK